MKDEQIIKAKLNLDNEPTNVARIFTLTKQQVKQMNQEITNNYNILEYYGIMNYKNKYYEVTFNNKDLTLHFLYDEGDNDLSNYLNNEEMKYMIENAKLVRIEI
jgi:hypothetical protein